MKALEVECSTCGVGPGDDCRTARPGKLCRTRVRRARIGTGVARSLKVQHDAEAKAGCDAVLARHAEPDETCSTCGGEGVLVGTEHDGRGGDQDVIENCPDCTADTFDDRDRGEFAFVEPAWMTK